MARFAMIAVWAAAVALLAGCPGGGGGGSLGTAKDFNYAKYDGGQGKLSDHAGRVTVVNFWAVW